MSSSFVTEPVALWGYFHSTHRHKSAANKTTKHPHIPNSSQTVTAINGTQLSWELQILLQPKLVDKCYTTASIIHSHRRAAYIERENSDKFCSEALIQASLSSTCSKPTARDFRRKSYSGFLRSEKIHGSRPGLNPRTSDPEESMITTGTPGSICTGLPSKCKKYYDNFTVYNNLHNYFTLKNLNLYFNRCKYRRPITQNSLCNYFIKTI